MRYGLQLLGQRSRPWLERLWVVRSIPAWVCQSATSPTSTSSRTVSRSPTPTEARLPQTVAVVARAGSDLHAQRRCRLSQGRCRPGTVRLIVGSNTITNPITSPPQGSGDWVTDTITYTATALDAGAPISIVLSTPTTQGNWDNVSLSDDSTVVPEPFGLALLGTGLAALGILRRRARQG